MSNLSAADGTKFLQKHELMYGVKAKEWNANNRNMVESVVCMFCVSNNGQKETKGEKRAREKTLITKRWQPPSFLPSNYRSQSPHEVTSNRMGRI